MNPFDNADKEHALRAIANMIARSEQAQEELAVGTSQHSLQKNRIHALRVAQALVRQVAGDEYTGTELERAKAPLASLISKSTKAQGKLKEDSWQYKMLRDNLEALHLAAELLDARSLEETQ